MWLGCLLALWAMALVAFVFLLSVGLIMEAPWVLLIPATWVVWRWLRSTRVGRRAA